jgi:mRNA interferase MazF
MTAQTISRGEIWLVDFSPGRGSEQKGLRPALVVQNDVGNRYAATTIVAAITGTLKEYPVTVMLESHEGGLDRESMVNLAQILTLDKSRLVRRLGAISQGRLREVDAALIVSLGIGSQIGH